MPTDSSEENHQNVSYLYKIQKGNDVSYIWQVTFRIQKLYYCMVYFNIYTLLILQKDITLPLDLSAFTCSQMQVSFAVVTVEGRSEFSPTRTLCVDGGMSNIAAAVKLIHRKLKEKIIRHDYGEEQTYFIISFCIC